MELERTTEQLRVWASEFGQEYTDRNFSTTAERDQEYSEYYGVKKSQLFRQFLPPERIESGRVLEVGSNIGLQLKILQSVNPDLKLYGLEPQSYAISRGCRLHENINFTQGNAFNIPFGDASFDVVMTNGVLIHIHPLDLPSALSEIYRCCKRYIHIHEYYADTLTEVPYRGHLELLWKTDFRRQYLNQFNDLICVDIQYLRYTPEPGGPELVDQVCLLEKKVL